MYHWLFYSLWKSVCWLCVFVCLPSPRRKHQMELDQVAHGVHVVSQRQTELVFGVALPLEREHHLFDRRAPSAHTAEALPQSQGHAPQCILHERLALGGAEQQEDPASVFIMQKHQTCITLSCNSTPMKCTIYSRSVCSVTSAANTTNIPHRRL